MNYRRRLATRVLHPSALVSVVVHISQIDSRIWCSIGSTRGNPDDADRVFGCDVCRSLKSRAKKMGQQEVAEIVYPILKLIALLGSGACWRDHDTRIVPQDIQAIFFCEELSGCLLDSGQIIELKLEK